MHIKTAVDQLALAGGNRYDQAKGIVVDERAGRFARSRSRGNLYVLVEVTGPAAERDIMASRLAALVRDAYYEWRGSVTAGLQNALREANNWLFEENRNSLPGEQWAAGASCAVLRDTDLFVAQVGPAVAYLSQEEEVQRFPDVSPWLDGLPPAEMDAAALGERRDLNVVLFHSQVQSGDILLLTESGLVSYISSHQWTEIMAKDSAQELLDSLATAGQGYDLSALVVSFGGRSAATAPPLMLKGDAEPAPSSAEEADMAELAPAAAEGRLRSMAKAVVAGLVAFWAVLLPFLKGLIPDRADLQPTTRRQSTAVKSKDAPKKRSATKTTGKAKPGRARAKKPKTTKPKPSTLSETLRRVLIGVAIAIPLLVAVVVLGVVVRRGQMNRAELDALWQQASTQWDLAQTTTDALTVRARLTEAEDQLNQLIELQPDNAEALELKKRVQTRLDEINQVRRINWAGKLSTYPVDANLSRVVVEGTHVFVLDKRNGRVYHHQLDDQQQALLPDTLETVLVSRGQQVGDVLVGDLVDMVWMPAGNGRQKSNLIILESGGSLLEYDPATQQLNPLELAEPDGLLFPEFVGSYYGRFYLLDSTANEIWRYAPTLDGYSTPPDTWLQTEVDLAGVEDMAIGDNIYLLYADGKIRKLSAGEPDTFDISGWDTVPRSPSAIFTRPPEDTKWLYVADRGNNRIVQTDKEGLFMRQFRLADTLAVENGDALALTSSLFVDEISGHAYVLSGQGLYLLILPD
jgi:hypothetical protein